MNKSLEKSQLFSFGFDIASQGIGDLKPAWKAEIIWNLNGELITCLPYKVDRKGKPLIFNQQYSAPELVDFRFSNREASIKLRSNFIKLTKFDSDFRDTPIFYANHLDVLFDALVAFTNLEEVKNNPLNLGKSIYNVKFLANPKKKLEFYTLDDSDIIKPISIRLI